jgi:RNA polymerase sigma factor (sigma-70 family)
VTVNDDEIAFAAIVARHQPGLYRYARRRVGPEDAADVVAEVFAAAWRHRERLPDPIKPWLFRTAWNALLHQFRAARRRANLAARLQAERDPIGDASHDPSIRVRAALARLRPVDQELLRLAYWEELDAAAISEIVGGTPQAARVKLHRARRRLAALLPDVTQHADGGVGLTSLFNIQELPR